MKYLFEVGRLEMEIEINWDPKVPSIKLEDVREAISIDKNGKTMEQK